MGDLISKTKIKARLSKLLSGLWVPDSRPKYWNFADDQYYAPSLQEVEEFLVKNPLRQVGATYGEVFDCDDYAFVMKGAAGLYVRDKRYPKAWCLGIVWGHFTWKVEAGHACNWVLCDDSNLYWVEPQTNIWYPIHKCSGNLTLILV